MSLKAPFQAVLAPLVIIHILIVGYAMSIATFKYTYVAPSIRSELLVEVLEFYAKGICDADAFQFGAYGRLQRGYPMLADRSFVFDVFVLFF